MIGAAFLRPRARLRSALFLAAGGSGLRRGLSSPPSIGLPFTDRHRDGGRHPRAPGRRPARRRPGLQRGLPDGIGRPAPVLRAPTIRARLDPGRGAAVRRRRDDPGPVRSLAGRAEGRNLSSRPHPIGFGKDPCGPARVGRRLVPAAGRPRPPAERRLHPAGRASRRRRCRAGYDRAGMVHPGGPPGRGGAPAASLEHERSGPRPGRLAARPAGIPRPDGKPSGSSPASWPRAAGRPCPPALRSGPETSAPGSWP